MAEFDYKLYWNTRLQGRFGLEAVGYAGLGKNFNWWMYRLRRQVFVQHVKKLDIFFPKSEILDAGSGSGFYISIWKDLKVKSLTGIDISKQSIINLRGRYPESTFEEIDIASNWSWEKKFQVISCMDVLFHIVDSKKFETAIFNLSSALQKGGYLVLSDNFPKNEQPGTLHHVSRSLSVYTSVLNANGLKIVLRRPTFYFLNFPVDSQNKLLHFLWKVFLKYIPRSESLGYIAGMMFYPLDRLLMFLLKEGPSTEIMICEKQ